jgi:uncharacterized membrane protein YgdD (TMEM256/DUF423 family)
VRGSALASGSDGWVQCGPMRRTNFGAIGAVLGGVAVATGAFGAHSLKAVLAVDQLAVFETAVRYQMYHALALMAVSLARDRKPDLPWWDRAGWSFLLGTVLFSGSLYVLVFTGVRVLGAVTPLGGLAFLIGWGCFVAGFTKSAQR